MASVTLGFLFPLLRSFDVGPSGSIAGTTGMALHTGVDAWALVRWATHKLDR